MMVSHSGLPCLEGCRDYPVLQKSVAEPLLQRYEAELAEYLRMADCSVEYLSHVPKIVCWYEGLVTTEEFIQEAGILPLNNQNKQSNT